MDQAQALKDLSARRAENKNRQPVDNSSLPAGSPMHFDCLACNADFEVDEDYTPPRPEHCRLCVPLLKAGLLN